MDCNTNRRPGAFVILAGLLLSSAASASVEPDRYITQKMIDASAGYPLRVQDLGKFKVTRVYLPEHANKTCKISSRSLGRLLKKGFAEGRWQAASGVKVTVELEMHITSGSNGEREILCYGGGKGCKAEVEVEEVVAR